MPQRTPAPLMHDAEPEPELELPVSPMPPASEVSTSRSQPHSQSPWWRTVLAGVSGRLRHLRNRRHDRRTASLSRRQRWLLWGQRALLIVLACAILAAGGLAWEWQTTPSVDGLMAYVRQQDRLHHTRYIPLAQISPWVGKALIAIEDERFYQHHGLDTIGLLRAAWDDLRAGKIVEGGSTLTAQLAKNAYLQDYDRPISLKLQDLTLALKIEQRYTKAQILEMYLNLVYFGEGAYGIAAAAHRYFGARANQLDPAQAALLAGLVQAPGYFDPWCHPEAAQDRQQVVIDHMVEQGALTQAQAHAARHEQFSFWAPGARRPHDAYCAA